MSSINKKHEIVYLLLLLLAALIWGTAFVAQSLGAQHVGAFTYLALRSWMGAAFLMPVIAVRDRAKRKAEGKGTTDLPFEKIPLGPVAKAGAMCGSILFIASVTQQIGIAYTTTAKSSFITALYVVIVPVLSIFIGKKPKAKIWLCIVLSVIGLYLLCMAGATGGFSVGDTWTGVSALFFALQIMAVDRYIADVDGVRLSQMQFLTVAVISTICMFFEGPSLESIWIALPSIAYAGIMSSGVAYTLQIVAQEKIEPSKAAIAMCMESVFGAISGWIVLGQVLSVREMAGCALMFTAIVLSQVPIRAPWRARK